MPPPSPAAAGPGATSAATSGRTLTNTYDDISFRGRYGKIYNRNLPKWYRREPGARIPVVPTPDDIHLFVAGGEAGRFSAFLPGWGHMTSPVLRAIDGRAPEGRALCVDGTCEL